MTALDFASGLPAATEGDALFVYSIIQCVAFDCSASLEWARQVPDSGLRERLIAAIAVASAKSDGMTAASMVASLSPGDAQNRAAVSVVQKWAQSSPQLAADWVEQFPDVSIRAVASQELGRLLDNSTK